jgi:hypothetical protein
LSKEDVEKIEKQLVDELLNAPRLISNLRGMFLTSQRDNIGTDTLLFFSQFTCYFLFLKGDRSNPKL